MRCLATGTFVLASIRANFTVVFLLANADNKVITKRLTIMTPAAMGKK